MKKYKVVIDRGSYCTEVEASSEEEAEDKAMIEFQDNDEYTDYDYWVGECDEAEQE